MDEIVWLVLVVLTFPVMIIVAFVMALKHSGRLKALEARVAQLELEMLSAGVPRPAPPASAPEQAPPLAPDAGARPAPTAADIAPPAAGAPSPVPPPISVPAPSAPPPRGAIPPAPPASAGLKERMAGFEEKVGARWAVWVGGIALALGGVFLVRYAVEQDLIGPAARVGLGLLLAALLLAAGEWLRRVDRKDGFAGVPAAHVPSVLTAAGTMTAFGSIFAAYELYHLIPPGLAFVLLALTGIATMLAALLHGPALAALGFAGAALTPFLVTTEEPNAMGVALLITVVGASALGVARLKTWRFLALLAIAGMVAWAAFLLIFEVPQAVMASGLMALALLALTAALLVPGHLWGPQGGGGPDLVSTLGATGALGMALGAVLAGEIASGPLSIFLLVAAGTLALAWRAPPVTFATVALALFAPVILNQWIFPPEAGSALAPAGPMAGVVPEPQRLSLGHFLAFGFGLGGLQLVLGFFGARRPGKGLFSLAWAAAGSLGAILMLVAAYDRLTDLERSLPFAALALGLALLLSFAAERSSQVRPGGAAAAAFATGGVVSLALALAFALEKGWLTVGLALAALAVAWVSTVRPLYGLRQLSAGLGLIVLAHVGWDPTIAGRDLGTTPIFNWLLWGYGVPALAFAASARLLARTADDWSRRVHEGLALLFAVLLAAFEVRHLAHGGQVYAVGSSLFETGLLTSIYAAYAVSLMRLSSVARRWLYRVFAYVMAAIAGLCGVGSLVFGNPFATGESVGGLVLNDLLVAYALPAGLALVFAASLPPAARPLRVAARGFAVVMGLAYLTFQASRMFQGPVLSPDNISDGEWYAYSAAWLGFGILLLLLGLWRHSRTLRLASGAVMVVTVLKVFLSDMADLEGVLRAFSFIGLGLVLVAMGWLYQRLLSKGAPPPATEG